MIPRYRLLAARIRAELPTLERSVNQTDGALARAKQQPADEKTGERASEGHHKFDPG